MNYTKAVFIREFEMLLLDLFGKGRLNGTVHTCVGQETIPLALAEYIVDGDRIFKSSYYGHFLAFGGDTKALLAEMLGKKSGVSGGIGGSQHLYNENFISNGIQAGLTPAAVGYAKVNALKNNNNIAVVFVGDGTLGEGLLYESLNLASIYQAPVLFVMENNGYAQSTPFALMYKGNIKDRINGFGIQYLSTTIWDESFEEIVKEAVNLTRTGQPVFVEIECYRLNPHSKGDDNRDEKEIAFLDRKIQ
jgi:2-oxoisovalerate dehydrogenase E1 component